MRVVLLNRFDTLHVGLGGLACLTLLLASSARAVDVSVDFSQVVGVQPMSYGTNETPNQLPPSAIAPTRLAEINTNWARYWLGGEVAPAQGVWSWNLANSAVSKIVAARGRPMICFAGIPDWMAASPSGDNSYLRNHPRDLNEWANYCLTIVQHFESLGYPVEDWLWEVWNEPNNSGSGSWSVQQYLDMYDAAAAVLRAAYPSIKIGGPSTDSIPQGWIVPLLQNGHDVQFITWHRYGAWDPTLAKPDAEYLAGTSAFGDAAAIVKNWIDTNRPNEGILNICGELNLNAYCCPIDSRIWEMMLVPWYTSTMRHMLLSGCDVEMFFVGTDKAWPNYGLFLGTGADEGKRSPAFFAKRLFAAAVPPDAQIVSSSSNSSNVEALALHSSTRDTVVLINKVDTLSSVTLTMSGVTVGGGVWYRFDANANAISDFIVTVYPGGQVASVNLNGYSVRVLEICPGGTSCDQDIDDDTIVNLFDNCPTTFNSDQFDGDQDGVGDVCDACPFDHDNDADVDDYCADVDNCPLLTNPDQADADGDGVGDLCDACPGTPAGYRVNEDGCPPLVKADLDRDGDVDMEDFGLFQACLDVAGEPAPAGCSDARLDGDSDIDPDDTAIFMDCLTAPGIPANPDCGG